LYQARRVKETDGGTLVPLQSLAAEYRVHVRTLRKAAQDGRLETTFSTRIAFGKLVAFASREAAPQAAVLRLFITHMLAARNIRIDEDLVNHLLNASEKRLARPLLLVAR
jgi:hypothetical protein